MVVLDEFVVDAKLGEGLLAEGLLEETARVAVDGGLEQDRPLEACGEASH